MNKFTILGCGSSLGSPWITNYLGKLKKNKKNLRSRCCAHIQYGNLSILIDTSPDIKAQFLKNKIKDLDAIIYTHEHADQTSGIFEMRPFYWKNKKKIPVYGSKRTIKALISKYTFCFKSRHGYKPIMKATVVKNKFKIIKNNEILKIVPFDVAHGLINATGFLFENVAYISDCNQIPDKSIKNLYNLKYLIIDCLKINKHPSHFNLDEALNLVNLVKPKKTILTNLHTDLDYHYLKKSLPSNIMPAYDGISFNF
ncbi:MAG: MBL fold hydrolase [Pelagibacteraceae bacterium]|nr:MBL fold hydrolase [Pelagibacteraceae bacterium]|tara:strand:+ start:16178 stop:16942 length:765 start_codon:yes stop_codon:yes gene_type:complete